MVVVDIYICPVEVLLLDEPRSVSVVAWSPQQTAPRINYSGGGDTNISLADLGTARPGHFKAFELWFFFDEAPPGLTFVNKKVSFI